MKTFDCSFIDGPTTLLVSERVRAETRNKAKYQFLRNHFPNDKDFGRKIRIKTVTPDVLEYEWRMKIVEDVISQQQLKIEALRVTNKNLEEENEEMKTSIRADINNIIEHNDKLKSENEELQKKLERTVREHREEVKKAQDLIDHQKITIDNLNIYCEELEGAEEKIEQGKENLALVNSLTIKLNDLESLISLCKEDNNDLFRQLEQAEDRLSLLQEENIRLGSHLDETVEKFREEAKRFKSMEKENEDLCRLLDKKDDTISELNRLLDQEQMRNIPSLLKRFFQKV